MEEGEGPSAAAPAGSGPSLSEVWSVEGKHSGCYTGGKVVWSQATKLLGCLSSEELNLVDVETQLPTRQVSQEGDGILTFALDPSGENVCTTHRSGLLRHFRLGETVTLMKSWKAHDELVADVSFDASGGLVASGSVDHTAKVWDFSGYFVTHSFRGHDGIVSIVRFHPTKLLLVTVANAEVRLWDLNTSKCVGVMKDHLASISSIAFAPLKGGAHQLVSGGRDQVVNIWNVEENSCGLARTVPVFENVEGVAVVRLKGLREAGSDGGAGESRFHRWFRSQKPLPPYVIFTVGDKAELRAWSPTDGKCVSSEPSPHGSKGVFRQVLHLAEASNQRLVTTGDDLNLVVWSLPQLQVVSYVMGHNDEIVHVQFIPDLTWPEGPEGGPAKASASRFVCITNDEHPRVVNCKGFGAKLLRGHTDMVIACDVSADGQWIATGGKDQTVRIWSSEEAKCACRLSGHTGPVSALSFPKKRPKTQQTGTGQSLWLVSASQDKIMKVWELPTAAKLHELAAGGGGEDFLVEKAKTVVVAHQKEVNDVVVSPNNKLIASGGQDKLVRIWKFPSCDLLGECSGHRRGIWCIAFSPSDQVIASASGDGTVRLWNLKDYSAIRSFQGHSSAVLRVCFLSSGMQLMTSSADGLIKLWQIRTADCAATYEEHTAKVWCIDVMGQQMVSGGADSKLCVWRDTTAEHAREKQDAKAEAAMKDTRIGLLVREGKIEAALTLALDLNRPGQMRQILVDYTNSVVEKCLSKSAEPSKQGGDGKSSSAGGRGGGKAPAAEADDEEKEGEEEESAVASDVDLRRWVISLSAAQLERLVEVLEQWNSNRRMASLAQMVMSLVLLVVPPSKLLAIEGMNATCGNILSYSSRHMARVEALLQKTFLFDLVLQSGAFGLAPVSEAGNADAEKAAAALKQTMAVLFDKTGADEEEAEADADEEGDEDAEADEEGAEEEEEDAEAWEEEEDGEEEYAEAGEEEEVDDEDMEEEVDPEDDEEEEEAQEGEGRQGGQAEAADEDGAASGEEAEEAEGGDDAAPRSKKRQRGAGAAGAAGDTGQPGRKRKRR